MHRHHHVEAAIVRHADTWTHGQHPRRNIDFHLNPPTSKFTHDESSTYSNTQTNDDRLEGVSIHMCLSHSLLSLCQCGRWVRVYSHQRCGGRNSWAPTNRPTYFEASHQRNGESGSDNYNERAHSVVRMSPGWLVLDKAVEFQYNFAFVEQSVRRLNCIQAVSSWSSRGWKVRWYVDWRVVRFESSKSRGRDISANCKRLTWIVMGGIKGLCECTT